MYRRGISDWIMYSWILLRTSVCETAKTSSYKGNASGCRVFVMYCLRLIASTSRTSDLLWFYVSEGNVYICTYLHFPINLSFHAAVWLEYLHLLFFLARFTKGCFLIHPFSVFTKPQTILNGFTFSCCSYIFLSSTQTHHFLCKLFCQQLVLDALLLHLQALLVIV